MWAPLIIGQGVESLGGICASGGFLGHACSVPEAVAGG